MRNATIGRKSQLGLKCTLLAALACSDPDGGLPEPGTYQYTATIQGVGAFAGTLTLATVTATSATGSWDVPGYETGFPSVTGVNGDAYLVSARTLPGRLVIHRIGPGMSCTGRASIVTPSGGLDSRPVTCTLSR